METIMRGRIGSLFCRNLCGRIRVEPDQGIRRLPAGKAGLVALRSKPQKGLQSDGFTIAAKGTSSTARRSRNGRGKNNREIREIRERVRLPTPSVRFRVFGVFRGLIAVSGSFFRAISWVGGHERQVNERDLPSPSRLPAKARNFRSHPLESNRASTQPTGSSSLKL